MLEADRESWRFAISLLVGREFNRSVTMDVTGEPAAPIRSLVGGDFQVVDVKFRDLRIAIQTGAG